MMSRQVRRAERRARRAELPFWRQGTFVAAAVFVGAVVLVGLFLLFTSGDRPRSTAETPPGQAPEPVTQTTPEGPRTSAGEQVSPSTAVAGNDECPTFTSDSGEDALSSAPEVQWSPVGDVATAASSTDGPREQESPVRCYARTAAGALLAAHNFTAEANSGVPLTALVEQRVAEQGPVYDVVAADAAAGRQGSGTSVTLRAYRFIEAGGDEYTVALVYSVPQSSSSALLEMRVTVRWLDGDWMVWDSPEPLQISEVPAGFIEWGPLVGAPE